MEYRIFDHINFLLFSHDCVIVPDLGAFILNREESVYKEEELMAPAISITFNQEIKHNDGMLTTFSQNRYSLSYDAAYKKIKTAVAEIAQDLKQRNRVVCGKIGVLYLNENQAISFEPNKNYVHPDYIGLSTVNLNPLSFLDEEIAPVSRKRYLGYAAAAAAIAMFFIAPSMHISDQRDVSSGQMADFSHILRPSLLEKGESATLSDAPQLAEGEAVVGLRADGSSIVMPQADKTAFRTYYIVVASETSKQRMNGLQNKIQKYFPDVAMLESSERYRLYAASFDDKKVAENFLLSFRKDHPKYKNAWLLSQRNKR